MAEELLDRPDVVAVLQQMGGERMAQRVTGGRLGKACRANRALDGLLEHRLMEMVTTPTSGLRIKVESGRRKNFPGEIIWILWPELPPHATLRLRAFLLRGAKRALAASPFR